MIKIRYDFQDNNIEEIFEKKSENNRKEINLNLIYKIKEIIKKIKINRKLFRCVYKYECLFI